MEALLSFLLLSDQHGRRSATATLGSAMNWTRTISKFEKNFTTHLSSFHDTLASLSVTEAHLGPLLLGDAWISGCLHAGLRWRGAAPPFLKSGCLHAWLRWRGAATPPFPVWVSACLVAMARCFSPLFQSECLHAWLRWRGAATPPLFVSISFVLPTACTD